MTRNEERRRGLKESRIAIATLQERWPTAFPKESHLIRPLVSGIIPAIAACTGWSNDYTFGVLKGWKRRAAYCKSVLREKYRYDLTGATSEETLDDNARLLATVQLARLKRDGLRRLEMENTKTPDEIPADFITAPAREARSGERPGAKNPAELMPGGADVAAYSVGAVSSGASSSLGTVHTMRPETASWS